VSCDEFVERVDVAAGMDRAQGPRDRLGQTYLRKKRDTAARVAGNKRPVAAHKPPALPALQDRNPSKQPRRLGIGQREQREFLTSV
jgi:hypothetical protein